MWTSRVTSPRASRWSEEFAICYRGGAASPQYPSEQSQGESVTAEPDDLASAPPLPVLAVSWHVDRRILTRHPWLTVSLRGGNNIVRLADAKIVAWSMYPAKQLTNILPEHNVVGAGESKETWFTQSR